jgi:hypothetical protein
MQLASYAMENVTTSINALKTAACNMMMMMMMITDGQVREFQQPFVKRRPSIWLSHLP